VFDHEDALQTRLLVVVKAGGRPFDGVSHFKHLKHHICCMYRRGMCLSVLVTRHLPE